MFTQSTNQNPPAYPLVSLAQRCQSLVYAISVFYLLYTLTNLYAANLHELTPLSNVDIVAVTIPFIDWMIVPYACSLPLFIAGFFIVKSNKQLKRLTHRLLLATLVATLNFYWLPLTFDTTTFDVVSALNSSASRWAWAYDILHTLDKPYNQLPSLHVSYALLLVISLWQSLTSVFNKILLASTGGCIAIATLFTWQHHLLDVLAGMVVAIIIWMIDHHLEKKHPSITKSSIVKYLVIAVSGFLLIQILPVVFWQKSFFSVLIGYYWLFSFLILALAYYWQTPLLFSKINGRHTLASLLIFVPIISVYQLMWWVANKMQLVQIPDAQASIKIPQVQGVNNTSIAHASIIATGKLASTTLQRLSPVLNQYQQIIWLDMGAEVNASFGIANNDCVRLGIDCHYINTPMLDVVDWNLQQHTTIAQYCHQLIRHLDHSSLSSTSQKTLIISQCAMGWSRSVAMLACVLAYFGMDKQKIAEHIANQYPKAHIDTILTNDLLQALQKTRQTTDV